MQSLRILSWIVCGIYATIPGYWLMVHPFARYWRAARHKLAVLAPLWGAMWCIAWAASYPWRDRPLYRIPESWAAAPFLWAISVFMYVHAARGLSLRGLTGHSELEPERYPQRLVTGGIHGVVRHPMYLGHFCTMLGFAVGAGTLACFGLLLFAANHGDSHDRAGRTRASCPLWPRLGGVLRPNAGPPSGAEEEVAPVVERLQACDNVGHPQARSSLASIILPMRFELFIAARYLRAKRRQAVIGVITAISVIGVAAGVASLIIALAINNGFRQDLQERLLGSTSHVNLMRVENDGIHDWSALLQRLGKLPHIQAVAPAIYEQVLISRGARAGGAVLKGIVPADERKVTALLDTVHEGSAQPLAEAEAAGAGARGNASLPAAGARPPAGAKASPSSLEAAAERVEAMPPIVLGKDLAETLGASVGSVVLVTSPQGELTPFGMVPRYMRFKVVGIFQSGFYDYDSTWALCSLSDSQRLFSLGDIASVLEFKVDDIYRAPAIGRGIEAAAGKGFMTTNWMEQNRALFRALRLERVVTFITIGLIVFVAALNILISLIMMVMEKTRDIAVLVSMGARRDQVRRIFIWQGLLIGIIGTVLGLAAGETLAMLAGRYHWIRLSAEVYAMDYVPFVPRPLDAVLVAIVSLAISFIATVYPSQSAARVLPAEALRYE